MERGCGARFMLRAVAQHQTANFETCNATGRAPDVLDSFSGQPAPTGPSLGSWLRTREDSEIGPSTVHYYGVFDNHNRLVVLVSVNSDVSDSWEREGDNLDYFHTYGGKGYALGVNVAVWILTH